MKIISENILVANRLVTPLGTLLIRVVPGASCTIDVLFIGSEEGMADSKGLKAATVVDGAGIQAKNVIGVVMEDLAMANGKEVEQELEAKLAELQWRRLVCFQKTRNIVVKKGDTTTASSAKVNSYLSPEDLSHMVDVLISSKYGEDLTHLTRVMADAMRNMLDALRQDLNGSLPRQVRSMVQQINGETQGKHVEVLPTTPNPNNDASQVNTSTLANLNQPGTEGNLNLQQPFLSNNGVWAQHPTHGERNSTRTHVRRLVPKNAW
jgi:hypothetical protein